MIAGTIWPRRTEPLGPSARRKLLGAGLACAAGDGTIFAASRAPRCALRPFNASSVSPTRTRRCSSACGKLLSTMAQAAPSRERRRQGMPVPVRSADRDEHVARASERLSMEQPDTGVAPLRASCRPRLSRSRQGSRRFSHRSPLASAAATASWSEKGSLSCPRSVRSRVPCRPRARHRRAQVRQSPPRSQLHGRRSRPLRARRQRSGA